MFVKFYCSPELQILELESEGMLCSDSRQLPGSNWVDEEEI